jgi:hypothetical protein
MERIVAGVAIEACVDDEAGRGDQQRITVRRRLGRLHDADIAAGARAVDDDHGLAEPGMQPRRNHPRHDIRRTAGCRRQDDPHGTIRIGRVGLRPGGPSPNGCHRQGKHGSPGWRQQAAFASGHRVFLLESFIVLGSVMTHRPPLFGQRTLDRPRVFTNVEASAMAHVLLRDDQGVSP